MKDPLINIGPNTDSVLQRILLSSPAVPFLLVEKEDAVRVSWIAETVSHLVGHTAAEIIDRREGGSSSDFWTDHLHSDEAERVVAAQLRVLEEGACELEYRFLHADGHYVWLHETQKLIENEGGGPREIVGSLTDISQRRHMEERLRQSQRMEGMGRLAGGIAHDFNNLLTSILGHAELAHSNLDYNSDAAENIRNLIQAAERSAELTQQLLAFARRQVTKPRNIELNTLIQNLHKALKQLVGNDIEFLTRLTEQKLYVCIDPVQMEQVLTNLTINARDSLEGPGTITIGSDSVVLDASRLAGQDNLSPGEYVRIYVEDSGTGVREEDRERLFDPFATMANSEIGAGLGLSVCYGIVQQFGGAIGVDSEAGHGSRVEVLLPRTGGLDSETETGEKIDVSTDRQDAVSETVLVVEDEPSVRGIMVKSLRNHGYQVLEARNGVEALKLAELHEEHLHLVVTDVVMPEMGGIALSERLKVVTPDTRVLFTSGHARDALGTAELSRSDVFFLQKPFLGSALVEMTRRVLDN